MKVSIAEFLPSRYIESLYNQSRYISNWERTLRATPESVPPADINRLPSQWLGSNSQAKANGSHQDVISKLWNLREQMLKDTLNIPKLFN